MEAQIPVIDLQNAQKESGLLLEACRTWGCFRIINHGVPCKLMEDMKSTSKVFFDRPLDIKQRIKGKIELSGYRPRTKANPLYEGFAIYDASPECLSSFCTELQLTPQQRETIESYVKKVSNLAKTVASLLAPFNFESWPIEFRVNQYSFTPESIGCHGTMLHTDDGFLTILQEDEAVGGLEVMKPSESSCVSVEPVRGTFVVNLGDAAAGWSNGAFNNVKHRVICKEARMRLSIATFLDPPMNEIIEPHPDFQKLDHSLRVAPFTHAQLRKARAAKSLSLGEALYLEGKDKL